MPAKKKSIITGVIQYILDTCFVRINDNIFFLLINIVSKAYSCWLKESCSGIKSISY